ncbi:MAG: TolC family protein, partial [Rikenellaceae bacterium]
MKKLIIISLLSATLNSCGLFSKYEATEEVRSDLYGSIGNKGGSSEIELGKLSWKEMFTDTKLQALISEALESNSDLLAAHENINIAEANLKSARLSYLPTLSLSPYISSIATPDQSTKYRNYSLPVSASWEIDLFGRITNQKESAKMLFEESEAYEQAVKTQIVASVANSYYTLLMLDSQIAIVKATEKSLKESVTAAEALKEAGMMSDAGLAQLEASYFATKTQIIELKRQTKQTENALCLILASSPRQISRGSFSSQSFPRKFSIGVPVNMLASRPDVRMAERALAQSFYGVNIARSSLYPSLSLSGSMGWTNGSGSVVLDPAGLLYNLMASLAAPLFNQGKNRAAVDIAKAQQEQAKIAFQQKLLEAGSEVNDALTLYQSSSQKAGLYKKQLAALELAVRSTQLTMNYGSTTYLEVLTAQQSRLSAELELTANDLA